MIPFLPMLGALFEDLAGIVDESGCYDDTVISPRWPVAPTITHAEVVAHDPASDGYIAYYWQRSEREIRLYVTGSGRTAYVRLFLPAQALEQVVMTINWSPTIRYGGNSHYAGVALGRLHVMVAVSW
ncbi:hypothetical protein [Chloroflexus sp.]|uniref:hypothetical protein n=1 Tax=Chloroflexus sp. TaxID=1904827 RepID=UPI00404AC855